LHLYEQPVRLSHSIIYDVLKDAYQRAGMDAWDSGEVPSHWSSNAFIARRYAAVIEGFARDVSALDQADNNPHPAQITILEVGSGSGRLAFLVIKHLLELLPETTRAVEGPLFRYVMTDLARANIDAWDKSGVFDDFVVQGIVDFAEIDAHDPATVQLIKSGGSINAASPTGPIVVIANYVLDTLHQDHFRVADGTLSECLVAVGTKRKRNLKKAGAVKHLELTRDYRPIGLPYYDNAAIDGVLKAYVDELESADFLLPVGMIRCLEAFTDMSQGPLLALIGDMGYRDVAELEGLRGDFMTVIDNYAWLNGNNFNALQKYFHAAGGLAMLSDEPESRFVTGVFVHGAVPNDLSETIQAIDQKIRNLGPREVCGLLAGLTNEDAVPSLGPETILYALKLSDWDPVTLMALVPAITKNRKAWRHGLLRDALMNALDKIGGNHYPLGITVDIPYRIGRLYQQLGEMAAAIQWFERGHAERGENSPTHHRLAQCNNIYGDEGKARRHAQRSLRLNPKLVEVIHQAIWTNMHAPLGIQASGHGPTAIQRAAAKRKSMANLGLSTTDNGRDDDDVYLVKILGTYVAPDRVAGILHSLLEGLIMPDGKERLTQSLRTPEQ